MADGRRLSWPQSPAPALAVALAALGAAVPVAAEQGAARRAWSDGGLNMTICLKAVGEPPIEGTLLDVPAARDFAALLPLTLTLTDYAATEKIGDLPRRLTTQGAPDGFEPKIGDIAFYAPWGNLAIFHKDFHHSPGLVRLGTISAGIQRFAVPGPMQVTIERTDQNKSLRRPKEGDPI